MRVVIQRVNQAAVHIEKRLHANIGRGMLALLGVEVEDDESDADWICGKLSRMRIFADAEGVMNRIKKYGKRSGRINSNQRTCRRDHRHPTCCCGQIY